MKLHSRLQAGNGGSWRLSATTPTEAVAPAPLARHVRWPWARGLCLALAVLALGLTATRGAAQTVPQDSLLMADVPNDGGELGPVAGELLVKFTPDTTTEEAEAILGAQGMTVKRYVPGIEWYITSLVTTPLAAYAAAPADLAPALQRAESFLADYDGVVAVEPNYRGTGVLHPTDPDYNSANLVYGPQRINAEAAWDVTTGKSTVVVAVVDSGVSLTHPEFTGRLVAGYDFVGRDTDPSDAFGHGTHIAGIVGAAINNNKGMVGIAPNVKIMPVRVLDSGGQGNWGDWASGIAFAVDKGAKVVNMSFGSTISSQMGYDAVKYAFNRGVTLVAAAGNNGSTAAFYPATWPEAISVSATDNGDRIWQSSNHGAHVDMSAPGWGIWSTNWIATSATGYSSRSGTSAAAAHVSGLAALLLSVNPTLTPTQVRTTIQQTARDLGAVGWDEYYGSGRVDAAAAVNSLLFRARANAGGPVFNDGSGKAWVADKLYTVGGWGYLAGTAMSTSQAVAGTTDDPLYQKWRDSPGEYRFTVPNGTYAVTLKFAEFEVTKANDRVMKISLEGTVVDNALSVYGTVGKWAALDRVYSRAVTDGVLNITLVKNGGSKPPVVSAIDVRQTGP